MKKTLEIAYFLWYNFSAIRMCGDFDGIALYMSRQKLTRTEDKIRRKKSCQ